MGRRILVVEDDPDLRHLYATALALARFDVTTASDGFEALQKIDSDPPDLILLDLGLPFVSGQAIAMEVAARAHSERIAIVIVTGQVIIAPPAAADCVLLKPVPLDELVRTVEHCLTGAAVVTGTAPALRKPRRRPHRRR